MLRRGVALKSLYLRFPCRFTAWLLIRQVARIERILPPEPSHVVETFGRLRFPPPAEEPINPSLDHHPVVLAHEARLKRERKEAEDAEAWAEYRAEFDELIKAFPKRTRCYRSVESR